ncbi:hypothetical protein C6I21_06860 [Alkalicoccus urumqiensis]|uniref:Uncharacterized protein n=1 Tax=Alkalicoccus urumqiensis TaxID=1548213 RepID=A0A2P6MIA0_ALKUR|nr:hypothetical protein C6I21_06860 [Alkalicoccus urumqiensis]
MRVRCFWSDPDVKRSFRTFTCSQPLVLFSGMTKKHSFPFSVQVMGQYGSYFMSAGVTLSCFDTVIIMKFTRSCQVLPDFMLQSVSE